ncbi:family 43 glycosylhydrolase [Acidipila sp. EB88]|uniref:family 43 glycosylhydrolase n=1 Tax=Acidipila sp. EB88 TaxID=2305226 RepID=UPI001F4357DD|nr:family 43 glycosylhydrolase [Acidipila sp. EB88]
MASNSRAQGAAAPAPHEIQGNSNPILGDGSYYSADPAPIVSNGRLYILAGRDEAPPDRNDFIMNEWQLFATDDVASHRWTHYPSFLKPEQVFHWATPGHAYAGQIVEAKNGRYYLYAPVQEANSTNEDSFAIGVAVASSPLGPWTDAHPSGPIVSQSVPLANRMQNIDPTAFVDEDGRAYLYWGTFGQLRGAELAGDMVTLRGTPVAVHTLPGFFEASWLFRRGATWYMVYADNQAGPHSPCTPTVYHACIAYGTAPDALGPWTYQGVILPPVSSTTSHPGVIQFKGKWYLVYHTADAKDGGNFRRSVAIDELHWDDAAAPARMLPVAPTQAPMPPQPPSRNLAPAAFATASNEPVPVQYWLASLNDGRTPKNPLPPEMWGTWTPHNPSSQWVQYEWSRPVLLNQARLWFWGDQPPGASQGVTAPASWLLEYWTGHAWAAVPHPGSYSAELGRFNDVAFRTVRTRCLRARLQASGSNGHYAAFGIEEFEADAPRSMAKRDLPPVPTGPSACPEK